MGVARYNYRNNQFISLKNRDGKPCIAYSICQWNHLLLLGGINKVYSFDLRTGAFTTFQELQHPNRFEIIRMAVSKGERLLCCSRWEGIYAIDLQTGRMNEAPLSVARKSQTCSSIPNSVSGLPLTTKVYAVLPPTAEEWQNIRLGTPGSAMTSFSVLPKGRADMVRHRRRRNQYSESGFR